MTQASVDVHVLVVGAGGALPTEIREALSSADLQHVRHAPDDPTAISLARELHPALVILDFSDPLSAGPLADKLRALTPRSWVVDFNGALRRRPEHSEVRLATTVPFLPGPIRFD